MKNSFIVFVAIFLCSFTLWKSDFEEAKALAKSKNQYVLLNFSGSDWCGPCIRMKNEIFNDSYFLAMADTSLIAYNADFPRAKSKQLVANKKKQNEDLAEIYNPDGKFPLTLLVDENGKIIKTWEGLPQKSAKEFTDEVKQICNAK